LSESITGRELPYCHTREKKSRIIAQENKPRRQKAARRGVGVAQKICKGMDVKPGRSPMPGLLFPEDLPLRLTV
jgi:hypothetical protein